MPTTAISPQTFAGMTALLADDEAINGLLTQAFLDQFGFTVTIAANGQEALAAARATRFDIIILDLQMPVMGGLETCAHLRQMEGEALNPTPIIAVTASTSTAARRQCFEHGFSDFISKPIESKVLLAKIAGYLAPASGA